MYFLTSRGFLQHHTLYKAHCLQVLSRYCRRNSSFLARSCQEKTARIKIKEGLWSFKNKISHFSRKTLKICRIFDTLTSFNLFSKHLEECCSAIINDTVFVRMTAPSRKSAQQGGLKRIGFLETLDTMQRQQRQFYLQSRTLSVSSPPCLTRAQSCHID